MVFKPEEYAITFKITLDKGGNGQERYQFLRCGLPIYISKGLYEQLRDGKITVLEDFETFIGKHKVEITQTFQYGVKDFYKFRKMLEDNHI